MNIIELRNVNKYYLKSKSPLKRFAAAVGRGRGDSFCALSGVDLSVAKGECVGIIGANGSGKSTLLRLIAGISAPDSGSLKVRGKISALLELGIGFNPEYTGIENVRLNALLNGEKYVREQEILSFAEIPKEFCGMPVKTYSSGMLMRLGFACTVFSDADIILIDEVLAVGDIAFQAKCFEHFNSLKTGGRTIIFVSHDVDAVRRLCSRAVWLDSGRVAADGSVLKVTSEYMRSSVMKGTGNSLNSGCINRYGSHIGSILSVSGFGSFALGEQIRVAAEVCVPHGAENAGVSLAIKDKFGLDLLVFRTERPLKPGRSTVVFSFKNPLLSGEYLAAVGVENREEEPISYYEYIEGAGVIRSAAPDGVFGLITAPCEIEVDS